MKYCKFCFPVAMSIACSVFFVSCSDDDSNGPGSGGVNPSGVFNAGIPRRVGSMSVTTNEQGLVTSMADPEDGVSITFAYPRQSRAVSDDVVMTVDDEGDEMVFNMSLNESGFAKYCKQIESDGDVEEWWFEYNADGQLSGMKRSEGGNEVTEISYVGGNITSVKMRSEDDGDGGDHTIDYGSDMLENVGCVMLFDEIFGIDMDEMKYAYFAGLLGKATKNLPVSNRGKSYKPGEESYTTEKVFAWSFNADNLPIQLTTVTTDEWGYEETETFGFVW